jgi:thiamine-phosphate pyrophosphorylase
MARKTISGLYAVTPDMADTQRLLALVEAALQGGAAALQYRNKTASALLRREQAAALLPLCRKHGVPLIINDDAVLCHELSADGVHLGGEDGEIAAIRTLLGPDKIIGASCYNRLDLAVQAKAQGADYIAFGACFESGTKPVAVRAPLQLFSQARNAVGLPAVAIGGITAENATFAIAAGADSVAVINAIFAAPDVRQAAQNISNFFTQATTS